jgi:hypothetical protein
MPISNVVELKRVVSQHQSAPLIDVAKAINIKLRLADQNENDARNHRIEAGEMLVSLQTRVETDGQDWWKFAKDHFDRTRKELEELMTYVSASAVAKAAIAAHPQKTDRAIAAETGVGKDTVRRARDTVGANAPTEKRTGKDGKQYKASKPKAQPPQQEAQSSTEPQPKAKPKKVRPKAATIDMSVVKQAGFYHIQLMEWTADYCANLEAWRTAHELDQESKFCVMQALELTAMRFYQLAQALDGR